MLIGEFDISVVQSHSSRTVAGRRRGKRERDIYSEQVKKWQPVL
jgi:hypothetical protein